MAFDPTRPGLNSTDRTSWITSGSLHEKFSLFFNNTIPIGADDYIWYIENTGTKTWMIDNIRLSSTVDSLMKLQTVTGTPSYNAEVAVTPVPLNLDSSNTITGTFNRDRNVTGITSAGLLASIDIASGPTWHKVNNSNVLIHPGDAVALLVAEATTTVQGTMNIAIETTPS